MTLSCELSIVAYTDLLGTKAKIINATPDEVNKHLNSFANEIKEAINYLGAKSNDDMPKSDKRIKFFSDSLIFSWPVIDDGGLELINTLRDIATYQFSFTLRNLFMRGAITSGLNYIDDDIVYGPATVESYNLENNKAKFPRVILSNSLINLVKNLSTKRDYVKNWVLKDLDDNHYFINYLYSIIEFMNQIKDYKCGFEHLNTHKQNIINNLKVNQSDSKTFDKYIWTGHYHNYFTSKLLENLKFDSIEQFEDFDFKKSINEIIIDEPALKNQFFNFSKQL